MENISNNEESIEKAAKRYRKFGWGYIAKAYTKEEEEEVYKEAAAIISSRFSHIISFDEIVEILSRRGKIYTLDLKQKGFYEYKTGNVGIEHFLNRITATVLHEFVHKIGHEVRDPSFENMSVVYREAGAEIVVAKSLSDENRREYLFHNVWGKIPERTEDSFLNVCLINQLNEVVGGEKLEKSILRGKDFFKPAIIEKYGEPSFVFLKETMEDLSREEKKYWRMYSYLSEEEKLERENYLKKKIFKIQNFILEAEFETRFKSIDSLDSGKKFLEDLKQFGLNRIRIKQIKDDGSYGYIDIGFKEVFEEYQKKIEIAYGKTDVRYDEDLWEKLYEKKEDIEEITEDEKRAILDLAIAFRKKHREPNLISKLLKRLGIKKEVLPPILEDKKMDKSENFNNYIAYKIDRPTKVMVQKRNKKQLVEKEK